MFENPRRGRQARNFTTNVPKILDLKSSSEQIFSENCRWVPLIQGKCSFDSPQSGKLKIYGSGTVSTILCMFRIETNGETDHLQHNLFVDISYKFTLA